MSGKAGIRDEYGLSSRERRFADEYLVDLCQRQAAIRAGVPPRSADNRASEMMRKPKVRAYIDGRMAERSCRVGLSAERVLRELARVAFHSPPASVELSDGSLREDAPADDTAAISVIKVRRKSGKDYEESEREIRFADKLKALELIMRHLGMLEGSKHGTGLQSGTAAGETGVVVLPEVSEQEDAGEEETDGA